MGAEQVVALQLVALTLLSPEYTEDGWPIVPAAALLFSPRIPGALQGGLAHRRRYPQRLHLAHGVTSERIVQDISRWPSTLEASIIDAISMPRRKGAVLPKKRSAGKRPRTHEFKPPPDCP